MSVDVFSCSGSGSADGRGAVAVRAGAAPRPRSDGGPVVDIHCHLGVPAAAALVDEAYHFPFPKDPTPTDRVNAEMMRDIAPRLNGLALRLQDMDRLGIDIQVMSPSPGQYYYAAPVESARAAASAINDAVAQAVSAHPDRFVGLGTVPLQDCDAAVKELRRCKNELGLRGVEIGTNVAGRELDDSSLLPFFVAAQELDMLVFMHPMGFTQPQRLSRFHLANVIGNPLDTTVALSHLIFGGVLDQVPRLKLCVAHGGGFIPAYAGRMEHAFHHRADCRLCTSRPPSEYLSRIHFDTLVFDPLQLDALVRRWGPERLCLGSDYPFDMAEPDPVGFHNGLEDSARNLILGANAQRLLGLAQAAPSR